MNVLFLLCHEISYARIRGSRNTHFINFCFEIKKQQRVVFPNINITILKHSNWFAYYSY